MARKANRFTVAFVLHDRNPEALPGIEQGSVNGCDCGWHWAVTSRHPYPLTELPPFAEYSVKSYLLVFLLGCAATLWAVGGGSLVTGAAIDRPLPRKVWVDVTARPGYGDIAESIMVDSLCVSDSAVIIWTDDDAAFLDLRDWESVWVK